MPRNVADSFLQKTTIEPVVDEVALVVKGTSGQTFSLQTWQDSEGMVLARIGADGTVYGIDGALPTDSTVVHLAGTETITGAKTFTATLNVGAGGALFANSTWLGYSDGSNYLRGLTYVEDSVIVKATAVGNIPLVVKGRASQTADLQQWHDSAGTVVARITPSGGVTAGGLNANAATWDSVMGGGAAIAGTVLTLTPTAARTGMIIKGAAAQTADFQQWQDSAGTVLANVGPTGIITFNEKLASRIGQFYITTADEQSLRMIRANAWTDNAATTYLQLGPSPSNAGGAIISGLFGSALPRLGILGKVCISDTPAAGPIIPTSVLLVVPGAASTVPVVVRGFAAQSGDLQQWQNSDGTTITKITSDGSFSSNGGGFTFAPYGNFEFGDNDGGGIKVVARATSVEAFRVKGIAAQTASLQTWANSADTVVAKIEIDGIAHVPALKPVSGFGPHVVLNGGSVAVVNHNIASNVPFIVRGMAAQTGDLQQWRNSAETVLAKVEATGWLQIPGAQFTTATGPYLELAADGIRVLGRTNAGYVPLIVRGMASQTGDLQQWQDSAGTMLAKITAGGTMQTSAALQADRVLGYSAAAFGIGANAVAGQACTVFVTGAVADKGLVVKGMAAQTGDLQQWQSYDGAVLAEIQSTGKLVIDPFNSTSVPSYDATIFAGTGWTSQPGIVVKGIASQTADLQQWMNSAGTVLAKVDAAGQFSAVSLLTNTLQYFTFAGPMVQVDGTNVYVVNRTTASNVPLIVKGMAAQTGDLQQWQNSAATKLAWIDSGGQFVSPVVWAISTDVASIPLKVRGAASQTGDLQQWQNSAGTVLSQINSAGNLHISFVYNLTATRGIQTVGSPGMTVFGAAADVILSVKGAASQTADLQQWQDSAGAVKASMNNAGDLTVRGINIGTTNIQAGTNPLLLTTSGAGNYLYLNPAADEVLYLGHLADTSYIDVRRYMAIGPGKGLSFDTTTGGKVGFATTEKIGFWNATPVVQPAGIADADGSLGDVTTKFNALLAKLETIGLLAVV